MEEFAKEIIPFLQYLLPGFVSLWVFHALTAFPRDSQFGQIIQALIFTFIVQTLVTAVKQLAYLLGHFWSFGPWIIELDVVLAFLLALLSGVLFSYFANTDKLHSFLRDHKITSETSYPSEWYKALFDHPADIVLHFHDGRRLWGWPMEWPASSSKGEFRIKHPGWMDESGVITLLEGVQYLVIDVKEIRWIELMELMKEGES